MKKSENISSPITKIYILFKPSLIKVLAVLVKGHFIISVHPELSEKSSVLYFRVKSYFPASIRLLTSSFTSSGVYSITSFSGTWSHRKGLS